VAALIGCQTSEATPSRACADPAATGPRDFTVPHCVGTALSCDTFVSLAACDHQKGCAWNGEVCEGSESWCDVDLEYDEVDCKRQLGCHWQAPNGDAGSASSGGGGSTSGSSGAVGPGSACPDASAARAPSPPSSAAEAGAPRAPNAEAGAPFVDADAGTAGTDADMPGVDAGGPPADAGGPGGPGGPGG
jgi:hypothetical protein